MAEDCDHEYVDRTGIEEISDDQSERTFACKTRRYTLPTRDGKQSYKLAFLELEDDHPANLKRDEHGKTQWQALEDALSGNKQKFVVIFIHGWRHDAQLGNEDVRRFKTLLAYSRSFMNQRQPYRDAELVGIYIGWRGALVEEAGNLSMPVTALTVLNRQRKSEQHSRSILRYLKTIEAKLKLDAGNHQADKMLIIGHSFGGNMLASALRPCLIGETGPTDCGPTDNRVTAISEYTPGTEMKPPLGDLTVLINPASPAINWTSLQREFDRIAALNGDPKGRTLFPLAQRPTYVSYTATDNWAAAEICEKRTKNGPYDLNCQRQNDWATRTLFPLAHLYLGDKEQYTTIGHLFPDAAQPYGATHEVVTNGSAQVDTEYAGALKISTTVCEPQDGWLTRTRKVADSPNSWDSGYRVRDKLDEPGVAQLYVQRKPKTIYLQYRFGLSPAFHSDDKKPGGPAAKLAHGPRYTPFWNIRAAPNTIDQHGGYVNYPLWCTINQMVLDDITAGSRPYRM